MTVMQRGHFYLLCDPVATGGMCSKAWQVSASAVIFALIVGILNTGADVAAFLIRVVIVIVQHIQRRLAGHSQAAVDANTFKVGNSVGVHATPKHHVHGQFKEHVPQIVKLGVSRACDNSRVDHDAGLRVELTNVEAVTFAKVRAELPIDGGNRNTQEDLSLKIQVRIIHYSRLGLARFRPCF